MNVLVTAGPTREFIDPVRFLSNRSTGRMGYAVARSAVAAGCRVRLISGPVTLERPEGLDSFVPVVSALDMLDAVRADLPWCDALVMCAAVADFRPRERSASKLHKKDLAASLELVPNPDILAAIREEKGNRFFVGFAAETDDVLESAAGKLARKGLDLIVANDVTKPGAGFEVDTNIVTFLAPGAAPEHLPLLPKDEVAAEIIRRVKARSAT